MDLGLKSKVDKLLSPYKHLNFVDRIYNKDKYPTLDLGDGSHASHKMAWAEVDGKGVMYPTVVQATAGEGAPLIDLGPRAGLDHALATSNYVDLSPEDAEWLSENYKLLWE